jgi:hypothetical protein
MACSKSNGKFNELIVGDWEQVIIPSKTGDLPPPPMHLKMGYGFSGDGILECKPAFFKSGPLRPVGFETDYQIKNDSLFYFDLEVDKIKALKISKLTPDTLVLNDRAYKRLYLDVKGEEFDALVFKNDVFKIYLNDAGTAKISGVERDRYTTISKKFTSAEFGNIRKAFMKADYQHLKDNYEVNFYCEDCVGSNITVSFYKKGKLLKTIHDSGQGGPAPFVWAYTRVQHLPYIYHLSFEKPNHE